MAALLHEIRDARQEPSGPPRRWFTSTEMDLIVWLARDGSPFAFQLCYDKGGTERALTLSVEGRLTHTLVEDGERRPGYKASGVLGDSRPLDRSALEAAFTPASREVPAGIVRLVVDTIRAWP